MCHIILSANTLTLLSWGWTLLKSRVKELSSSRNMSRFRLQSFDSRVMLETQHFLQWLTWPVLIGETSLSFGFTTDTIFIMHQPQRVTSAIVKKVVSLDLLLTQSDLIYRIRNVFLQIDRNRISILIILAL